VKAIAFCLALCATFLIPPGVVAEEAPVSKAARLGELQPLPAQTLQAGECGIFLWTRREQPDFVFFASSGTSAASIRAQGRDMKFNRAPTGEVVSAKGIVQHYVNDRERLALSIDLRRGDRIENGERISLGVITVTDESGWEAKTPVTGVATCQPR
jgi:hypothetical protein